jgi:RNA polymerase subunit RPABC4/transcription elongation factor Spt4
VFAALFGPDPRDVARDLNRRMERIHAGLARLADEGGLAPAERARLTREVARERAAYTRRARRHAKRVTLERTCDACADVWRVDPRDAGALHAAARAAVGRRDAPADVQAWTAALDAFHACPVCEGTAFDERWVARPPDPR